MANSIDNFKNYLSEPALANRFAVYIPGIFGSNFNVRSVNIPGYGVQTNDIILSTIGYKQPFGQTYEDCSMRIMCTDGLPEYRAIYDWMVYIMGSGSGYLKYPNQYITDINIYQIDQRSENTQTTCVLTDAFPMNLGSLSFDHGSENTVAEFDVTFAYFDYFFT